MKRQMLEATLCVDVGRQLLLSRVRCTVDYLRGSCDKGATPTEGSLCSLSGSMNRARIVGMPQNLNKQ